MLQITTCCVVLKVLSKCCFLQHFSEILENFDEFRKIFGKIWGHRKFFGQKNGAFFFFWSRHFFDQKSKKLTMNVEIFGNIWSFWVKIKVNIVILGENFDDYARFWRGVKILRLKIDLVTFFFLVSPFFRQKFLKIHEFSENFGKLWWFLKNFGTLKIQSKCC